jgi:dihydrofolate reductase
MAKLTYSMIASLDGYVADADGEFGWAQPDGEVHTFINDLERSVGTYLYGRRMYETMAVWETDPAFAEGPGPEGDFARIWQAADKVVYSRSLKTAITSRTRIERDLDPEAVREMKASAKSDLSVSGPTLAARAFRAGLVDEFCLFLAPTAVGRGKPALPTDTRLELSLLDERRFGNGMVYLRYRVRA